VRPDLLERAVRAIRAGGVVACATDTQVGLLALATNPTAVARVLRIKGARRAAPISVLVADVDTARSLAAAWSPAADVLAAAGWPGPLTLVVTARAGVFPPPILARGTTVGLRVPGPSPALDLLRLLRAPVTGTSANATGDPPASDAADLAPAIVEAVDLVVPGRGRGPASRVVDVSDGRVVVVRPG
jgi:L-threonylcarbamoyladenylate synthase